MFSIIIPLYNKSEYIEKCLHSVINQTFQDFEVIVVNDGSTDDGVEKVKKIISQSTRSEAESFTDDKRSGGQRAQGTEHRAQSKYNLASKTNSLQIKLLTQPNSGVSTARNNGVKAAKFNYIAFLDADDWWEPTYLEEMRNLIEEFPEAGLYGSGYYLNKNGRKRIAKIGVEPGFEKGIINYCRVYAKTLCMPLWTGAVVIPRKVFESENGFRPELKLGEDFDLWLRTASRYPVILLNKPLACYNQDIELNTRAVGSRLYYPSEHMIFSDYSEFTSNFEFQVLYERLALYNLLPYFLENKNSEEVKRILFGIHWKRNAFRYQLYYRVFPRSVSKGCIRLLKSVSWIRRKVFIS
jgi:glycosyltransferase involved in cell wall biosynthesis